MQTVTFGACDNGFVDVRVDGERVGTIQRHDLEWAGVSYTVEGSIAHDCGLENRSFKTLDDAKTAIRECFRWAVR